MKALLFSIAMVAASVAPAQVTISGTDIVNGTVPALVVSGLHAKERIRVHSLRLFTVWKEQTGKGWQPVPRIIHGWADFRADASGRIDLAAMAPLAGTYSGTDPYGILWSGQPIVGGQDPYLPAGFELGSLAENGSRLMVSREGKIISTSDMHFKAPSGLVSIEVNEGRLNGHYAAPANHSRHPALILLHGSEGGSREAARDLATRFAGQGYAAFAFNYFAWDLSKLNGVPNAHVNQPIEMLNSVRDWMARRPEADVNRMGLYGHSKGAEYAAVAATRLTWVDAVIACVPTDVVWEGYGIGDGRNRRDPSAKEPVAYSSFSWQGKPVPYIPLKGDRNAFHSNTDYYEAKRAELGSEASRAAIPVEKSRAAFLWLGGGRDEVWASGKMSKHLDARMRKARKRNASELVVYEKAGHAICGEGGYPVRVWQDDSSDPRDPDLDANGRATVDAWARMKKFLSRHLKGN